MTDTWRVKRCIIWIYTTWGIILNKIIIIIIKYRCRRPTAGGPVTAAVWTCRRRRRATPRADRDSAGTCGQPGLCSRESGTSAGTTSRRPIPPRPSTWSCTSRRATCGSPASNQGPDLQNILQQSYDYLAIMPNYRLTTDV